MSLRDPGAVLLISCYELGHQPMGLALPMGFLQRSGFHPAAMDIAIDPFDAERAKTALFVGISVPMHTALRLGVRVAERIRELNPGCRICFYGLYAALNSDYLLSHGADYCIGGEYEGPLIQLLDRLDSLDSPNGTSVTGVIQKDAPASPVLEKLDFAPPLRNELPILNRYAQLECDGEKRTAGYVEASRGCLHLCTHCPIPPVYGGRFFILPRDIVVDDVRKQIANGASHITFGDPDFLNGPKHALRIVEQLHDEFPKLTFDFTSKVEHLLKHAELLPHFAAAGCLFIISAVESLSDRVLTILDKRHTREDVENAWRLVREAGIVLRPTWVSFTPWTTLEDFQEVLDFVESNGLIDHVDPVQYSVRLLIPPGSWLENHEATLPHRGELDQAAFTYRWEHPDPFMDALQKDIARTVELDAQGNIDPGHTFYKIKELAHPDGECETAPSLSPDRKRVPRMTESWFC